MAETAPRPPPTTGPECADTMGIGSSRSVVLRDGLAILQVADDPARPMRRTPQRPFAEAQWPRLSPDGQHLAWQEIPREEGIPKPALRVTPVAGGAPLDLGPLTGPTRTAVEWFDTTGPLVCDGQGVRLVALDGTSQSLAGPGSCFVPRGAR